jgi:hypothetical protein
MRRKKCGSTCAARPKRRAPLPGPRAQCAAKRKSRPRSICRTSPGRGTCSRLLRNRRKRLRRRRGPRCLLWQRSPWSRLRRQDRLHLQWYILPLHLRFRQRRLRRLRPPRDLKWPLPLRRSPLRPRFQPYRVWPPRHLRLQWRRVSSRRQPLLWRPRRRQHLRLQHRLLLRSQRPQFVRLRLPARRSLQRRA